MGRIARAVAGSPAGTAVAPAAGRHVRVLGRELVAVLAVRLARVLGRQAAAAPVVLGVRDDLQVCRVDARTVAAEVVDGQAVGDRAVVQFPGDSVSVPTAAIAPADLPVPSLVLRGGPIPARVRPAPVDLRPEPFFEIEVKATRPVASDELERLAEYPSEWLVILSSEGGSLSASAVTEPVRDSDGGPDILALHRGKGLLSRCHGTGRLQASRSPLVACNYTTLPLSAVIA